MNKNPQLNINQRFGISGVISVNHTSRFGGILAVRIVAEAF
jgi:uncharacterized membrane protein